MRLHMDAVKAPVASKTPWLKNRRVSFTIPNAAIDHRDK
jgi:hypothetical protein